MTPSRTITTGLGLMLATALSASGSGVLTTIGGGVAGNLATDLFKGLNPGCVERFLDRWFAIKENRAVDQALRLAQISGLREALKRFDKIRFGAPDRTRDRDNERFSRVASAFLDRETKTALSTSVASESRVSTDEQSIRAEVLRALPLAFEQSLASGTSNTQSTMSQGLGLIRAAVEAAVLEEIRLQCYARQEDVPALFREVFFGTAGSPGWFDWFIAEALNKLGQGGELSYIWNAQEVAILRVLYDDQSMVVNAIDNTTKKIKSETSETLLQLGAVLKHLALMAETVRELRDAAAQAPTVSQPPELSVSFAGNDQVMHVRRRGPCLTANTRSALVDAFSPALLVPASKLLGEEGSGRAEPQTRCETQTDGTNPWRAQESRGGAPSLPGIPAKARNTEAARDLYIEKEMENARWLHEDTMSEYTEYGRIVMTKVREGFEEHERAYRKFAGDLWDWHERLAWPSEVSLKTSNTGGTSATHVRITITFPVDTAIHGIEHVTLPPILQEKSDEILKSPPIYASGLSFGIAKHLVRLSKNDPPDATSEAPPPTVDAKPPTAKLNMQAGTLTIQQKSGSVLYKLERLAHHDEVVLGRYWLGFNTDMPLNEIEASVTIMCDEVGEPQRGQLKFLVDPR